MTPRTTNRPAIPLNAFSPASSNTRRLLTRCGGVVVVVAAAGAKRIGSRGRRTRPQRRTVTCSTAVSRFAGVLTAKHDAIGEYHSSEQAARFALAHRFGQLVLDPPSSSAGNAAMTLERGRRTRPASETVSRGIEPSTRKFTQGR